MAKYLLIASISIITFLIIGRGSGMAECAAGDLTGHFQGTAVSKKAGKLDTSLDLRCVKQQYQGELITPVGVYTVKSGTAAGVELQLQLVSGSDTAMELFPFDPRPHGNNSPQRRISALSI